MQHPTFLGPIENYEVLCPILLKLSGKELGSLRALRGSTGATVHNYRCES